MKQDLTTYVIIFLKTLLVLIATILTPIKGLLFITGFAVFLDTNLTTNIPPLNQVFLAGALGFIQTAETASTKAPRTIPLGIQTFPAAAAVGVTGQTVSVKFDRALPVYPGEFLTVTAKNLGAVTTTGVITFLVTYDYGWAL